MRILVAGANGFIGNYLVPQLHKQFPTAAILPLGIGTSSLPGFESCDFTDASAVSSVVKRFRPTHAFHLVGIARVQEELGVPQYFKLNFLTTRHLADALCALEAPTRMFFSSSVHIYGNQTAVAVESLNPRPGSAYAFTKFLAERMLQAYVEKQPQLNVTVGRLYSCFGPGQPEGFVTADFCKRIVHLKKKGQKSLKVGPLFPIRRFLDVRDLVEIMPRLLTRAGAEKFDTFNIASPHEKTIGQLLESLLKIAKTRPTIESSDQSANPFKGLAVSIDKLTRALPGLSFRSVETTLSDMWEEAGRKYG